MEKKARKIQPRPRTDSDLEIAGIYLAFAPVALLKFKPAKTAILTEYATRQDIYSKLSLSGILPRHFLLRTQLV